MGVLTDKLNTAMRDFVRFTGDGKPGAPVGKPLPIGDPASGEWNPPKKQVREAFVALAGSADDLGDAVDTATGAAQTATTKAGEAVDSANNADTSATQAQLAALAAGAPLYLTKADGIAGVADGAMFLVYSDHGVDVYTRNGVAADYEGSLADRPYKTVTDFIASTETVRGVGTIWQAGGFRYEELVTGTASDLIHLSNAAGVLFKLIPKSAGVYDFWGMNPAGDGVTDDWPKLKKLLLIRQPQGLGIYPCGPTITFDGRKFFFDTDANGIQLKALTHLIGCAQTANNNDTGTVFLFPPGVSGLIVNRYNTLNGGKEAVATGGADGSSSQDISYLSSVSSDKTAHAINLRARAWIKGGLIKDWGGNGIHINATAGGSSADEGNANNWRVDSVRAEGCENGLFDRGSDANAGAAYNFDGSKCRRWGVLDQSFLGNTFTACHTATSGFDDLAGTSAFATYAGKFYQAVPNHVGGATEAQYVAVQPGTNSSIWSECNSANGAVAWTVGLPSGTYRDGGGYCSTNANARSSFVSCYSEGGQGNTWLSQHSIAMGGFFFESPILFGAHFEGRFQQVWSRGGFKTRLVSPTDDSYVEAVLGGKSGTAAAFEWESSEEGNTWRWQYLDGNWLMRFGNVGSALAMQVTGPQSALNFGTSSPIPYVFNPPSLAIGSGNNARRHFTSFSLPTSGIYARGDVIYKVSPVAGGTFGWSCTTGGTAGSTAGFKEFGAIDA